MCNSYDISFKQLVIEEYFTNQLGYKNIANKYGIAQDTVRNCVLKYKKETNSNEVSLAVKSSNFVEVTDKIYSIPAHQAEKEELVTLFCNGFSISIDAKGIKAKMEAVLDDLNKSIANVKPEEGSMLDKACKYWNNLKCGQLTYLANWNIELDNNEAEKQTKSS